MSIVRRIANLFRRSKLDQEIEAELRAHIEMRTADNIAAGMSPEEARRQATLRFGSRAATKEQVVAADAHMFLDSLWQDLRYALRMLRKSPGFTAVAVLTLALGIGANTAIFSLIDGILLRSLPVPDAKSLVVLKWSAHKGPEAHSFNVYGECRDESFDGGGQSSSCSFSAPFFRDVAAQKGVFSHVAAYASSGPLTLSGSGSGAASVLTSVAVSGDYFATLDVRAAAGRLIAPSDDSPSAPPVVVVNYGYWKSHLGSSPSVIGKTILLNNVPFIVIGVAEPRFDSLSPGNVHDVWVPLSALGQVYPQQDYKTRPTDVYSWWLMIVARLKPGVARTQAQAAVSTLFRNDMLHGAKPLSKPTDDPTVAALLAPSELSSGARGFARELYVLMTAVGIVLLIACANVAGLLLSRATGRQKEMAVRLALGAGRGRIVRQLLSESVLLSLIGGGLGILFAVWGIHAVVALMSSNSDLAFGFSPGIDGRVLAFTLAASVLTGIVFGLAPAFRSLRVDLTPALKEGASGSAGEGRTGGRRFSVFTLGNGLVVAQVALAVVVLVGAGLLVRTLQNLKSIDPGFATRNVLTFSVDPTLIDYKTPQTDAFFRNLQQRLAAIPQVESVSYSNIALLTGSYSMTGFHLPGMPKDKYAGAAVLSVGADFFSTLRMRLLAGRNFTAADFAQSEAAELDEEAQDTAQKAKEAGPAANPSATGAKSGAKAATPSKTEAPVAVIVNKTLVQKYFSKVNPLGQRFGESEANAETGDTASPGWVIVGVVGDAKYQDLKSNIEATMYLPASGGGATFAVRTTINPAAMTASIRNIVSQMDSNLPVTDIHTETQRIERLVLGEAMIARLSSFFAGLALVLACIGLYGLLSYEVARRTRELGIRMALGAQQRDLLRLVVGQGILLALIGAVIGIGAAIGVTRFVASMLYGVHASDPLTFGVVSLLLFGIALLACYIPARRAMRVDPMVALRYE
jgi:predicted permease